MRILALWKQMSSYSAGCFRALAEAGATVRVLHRAATPDAPYDDAELTAGLDSDRWVDTVTDERVAAEVEAFAPDVLLVCSWDVGAYRRVSTRWRGRGLRILCMDNAWRGTAKQWLGRLSSPAVVRRAYDAAFFPGERQAEFARRLGFPDRTHLWGFNCCDETFFADGPVPTEERFLYVGRLVADKAVDVLADAYQRYRAETATPWDLRVAGTGPLASELRGAPGVELLDFVAPAELPATYQAAGCLVLPSRFEPWGVVVHEAAASGLPVLCTTAVGAATRFVCDGYNGRLVEPGDAGGLADAMAWVAGHSPAERARLGQASRTLAAQITPTRWAEYLLERSQALLPRATDR